MSITTKKGDKGKSSLSGGETLNKCDICFECMGDIDELSALLSLIYTKYAGCEFVPPAKTTLGKIMAFISCPENRAFLLSREEAESLYISDFNFDGFCSFLNSEPAALLNYARTVTRRAERKYVKYSLSHPFDPNALVFLNRLSDALYVFATRENNRKKV